jgi:hypothetical protein
MPLNFFRIKDIKEVEKRPKEFLKAKSKGVPNREKLDFSLLNQGDD